MSYVEEFCENIAIIDKGQVVLEGELSAIKNEFGLNQHVINAQNLTPEQLSELLEKDFSDYAEITGIKKEYVIIKLHDNVSKKEFLQKILNSSIDIEHFENYKPSLNDIFVAKVGEQ